MLDEAHHATKDHPTRKTMHFYHSQRTEEPASPLPHILGLTASPMNRDNLTLIRQLEQNLNAVCRSPTINIDEYRAHVYLPDFVRLHYANATGNSVLLPLLHSIIGDYRIEEDPQFKKLQADQTSEGSEGLEKVRRENATWLLKQLRTLSNHAIFMQGSLGAWATDHYISACVAGALRRTSDLDEWLFTIDDEEQAYLRQTLQPILQSEAYQSELPQDTESISDKVLKLVQYLDRNLAPKSACMVFVQRRSTAWALKELLVRMVRFKIFTLVGTSDARRNEIADLANSSLQDECFAEFKAGERDICICTQVGEEGLDVQACDLVICFDHPANLKSFIQRRGRARRSRSCFVILHAPDDVSSKYDKWAQLEAAMKEEYTTRKRNVEDLEMNEAISEQCDRELRVPSTGARLDISAAKQHLHHFCQTLPRRTQHVSECSPVYVLRGTHNVNLSCQVVLPSSLPPELQKAYGQSEWRTEAMAQADAAFEMYVKLYEAGLVTDHLLPPVVEKETKMTSSAKHESMTEVHPVLDPWEVTRTAIKERHSLFAHKLEISDITILQILLPAPLTQRVTIQLQLDPGSVLFAHVYAEGKESCLVDHNLGSRITRLLFKTTLARKLPGLDADNYHLPYLILPDVPIDQLEAWLETAEQTWPLSQKPLRTGRDIVVLKVGESTPYFVPAESCHGRQQHDPEATITAVRLPRRLDFTRLNIAANPQPRNLKVNDCIALGLPSECVRAVSYLPSIMRSVSLALRTEHALTTVLDSLQFQSHDIVTTALAAPNTTYFDYQRLEYLGDALLKFHSTVNIFFNHPLAPEGQLSLLKDSIVKNERLMKSTVDLGLDRYISTDAFSARHWTLKEAESVDDPRQLSSKILADIIESLLGAAYSDGKGKDEERLLRALSLFLPEVSWVSPAQFLSELVIPDAPDTIPERLLHVERILGYTFKHKRLLAEALTHSTAQVSRGKVQSYERLEFLGDAIIDILVKERLFDSKHEFNENEMHSRHIALVNKDIFAYLTTKNGIEIEQKAVESHVRNHSAMIIEKSVRKCLHDFVMKGFMSREEVKQNRVFLDMYEKLKDDIDTALSQGERYPWTSIYALNSPKWCSDILESLTGAVFIDSGGSLDECHGVLARLGLMRIVDRAVQERDWDVQQPMRKVREMNPNLKIIVKSFPGRGSGCRVKLGDEVLALVKGCSCKLEAESRAAEEVLRKVREGLVEIGVKKKGKGKRKAKAKKARESEGIDNIGDEVDATHADVKSEKDGVAENDVAENGDDEEIEEEVVEGASEESRKRKRNDDVMNVDG